MHISIYWRWFYTRNSSVRFEVSVYQVSCLHLQTNDMNIVIGALEISWQCIAYVIILATVADAQKLFLKMVLYQKLISVV